MITRYAFNIIMIRTGVTSFNIPTPLEHSVPTVSNLSMLMDYDLSDLIGKEYISEFFRNLFVLVCDQNMISTSSRAEMHVLEILTSALAKFPILDQTLNSRSKR